MKRWLYAAIAAAMLFACGRVSAYRSPTVTYSGSVQGGLTGVNTLSGDETGSSTFGFTFSHSMSTAASSPDIVGGGGYSGSFTCPNSGGTLNLADSTNICKTGATGTIAPKQGYVITTLKKLRAMHLENTDATNTVDVTLPGSLGLAGCGWVASAEVVKLQPGGDAIFTFPAGSSTLTAGTNDALVFTAGAGTPTVKITCVFN